MEKENVVQRYVSLLTNGGFKAVFGDRNNKDVVMSVINTLLPEGKQVEDIEYAPTEHQGQTLDSKEFQYDFMCKGSDGTTFIVEMQCYPDQFWFRRCVSYASRAYDRQNKKGDDYDVAPVYLIGLMGSEIKHQEPQRWKGRYVSEYTFREKETNELQDETIFIIFAEMARFDKDLDECENDVERMLYVIKNGWKLQNCPSSLRQKIFARLFEACEIAMFSKEKRIKYDQDMYDERKRNGELNTARKIGREEGRAEGREEGRIKGREEGRAEGRAEGRTEGKIEEKIAVARKMLAAGMPVEQITEFTGLTNEEIAEL